MWQIGGNRSQSAVIQMDGEVLCYDDSFVLVNPAAGLRYAGSGGARSLQYRSHTLLVQSGKTLSFCCFCASCTLDSDAVCLDAA